MASARTSKYKDKIENGELDLSMMELRKIPINDLAPLKKAVKLDLSNNFIATIQDSISMLNHLVQLDLSNNVLKELPESFGALVKLKHLNLCNNELTYLPLSFCKLKALRWLDVKNNPLIPELAQIAGDCSNAIQCQQCAKNIVTFLSQMQKVVQEEQEKEKTEEPVETVETFVREDEKPKQKKKKQKKQNQEKQNTKSKSKKNKNSFEQRHLRDMERLYMWEESSRYNYSEPEVKKKKKFSWKKILFLLISGITVFYLLEKKLIPGSIEKLLSNSNITMDALPPSVSSYITKTRDFFQPVIEFSTPILANFYEQIFNFIELIKTTIHQE